jgi:hypothetical protein
MEVHFTPEQQAPISKIATHIEEEERDARVKRMFRSV